MNIDWREMAALAVIAAAISALDAVATLDAARLANWESWAIGVGVAALSAAARRARNYLRSRTPEATTEAER